MKVLRFAYVLTCLTLGLPWMIFVTIINVAKVIIDYKREFGTVDYLGYANAYFKGLKVGVKSIATFIKSGEKSTMEDIEELIAKEGF